MGWTRQSGMSFQSLMAMMTAVGMMHAHAYVLAMLTPAVGMMPAKAGVEKLRPPGQSPPAVGEVVEMQPGPCSNRKLSRIEATLAMSNATQRSARPPPPPQRRASRTRHRRWSPGQHQAASPVQWATVSVSPHEGSFGAPGSPQLLPPVAEA